MSFVTEMLRPKAPENGAAFAVLNDQLPTSPEAWTIRTERSHIHVEFEATARFGFVPAEALIVRLDVNHRAELAEDQRQLDALEQALEAHLRRLDSLFPAPVPPPPTPPEPPRARTFRRLSDGLHRPNPDMRH